MTRTQLLAFLGAMAIAAGPVYGHGFRIRIESNKLLLDTDDPTANGALIYKAPSLLGPPTSRSTDHPGYDVDTLNGPSGFAGGESIRFDALGPLWYSDGGAPVASPAGVNLEITSQDLGITDAVIVTGTSGFQSGFLIGTYEDGVLGVYEHQLNYQFDVPGGLPVGAFAVKLQLTGANITAQPFTPSEPVAVLFNNGLDQAAYAALAIPLAARALAIPGDLNFDGVVDIFDVNVASDEWGNAGPTGDANDDGVVDIFDVNVISDHWGESIFDGNGVAAVPEPSAIALYFIAAICGLTAVRNRRRNTFLTHRMSMDVCQMTERRV